MWSPGGGGHPDREDVAIGTFFDRVQKATSQKQKLTVLEIAPHGSPIRM
jgi:hypothetical protein